MDGIDPNDLEYRVLRKYESISREREERVRRADISIDDALARRAVHQTARCDRMSHPGVTSTELALMEFLPSQLREREKPEANKEGMSHTEVDRNPLTASIGTQVLDAAKRASSSTKPDAKRTRVTIGGVTCDVFWTVVDGPIGAGKSVLMDVLEKRLRQEYPDERSCRILMVPEDIKGMEDSGLFARSQLEPEKYAYEVQTMWFCRRTRAFRAAWGELARQLIECPLVADEKTGMPPTIFIISERSILTDPIFMEVQQRMGYCKRETVNSYFELHSDWMKMYPFWPDLVVFCRPGTQHDTSVDVCQKRIIERNRGSELNLVTPEYNGCVLDLYEEYMGFHDDAFEGRVENRSYLVKEHGVNDYAGYIRGIIPVITCDTLANYRDDPAVARDVSSTLLAHMSPKTPLATPGKETRDAQIVDVVESLASMRARIIAQNADMDGIVRALLDADARSAAHIQRLTRELEALRAANKCMDEVE